jgi:hypothetical protein
MRYPISQSDFFLDTPIRPVLASHHHVTAGQSDIDLHNIPVTIKLQWVNDPRDSQQRRRTNHGCGATLRFSRNREALSNCSVFFSTGVCLR